MRGALIPRVVGAVVLGLAGWQGGEALGDAVDSPGFMPWGLALAIAGVVVGAALTPYAVILPLRRMLRALRAVSTAAFVAGVAGLILGLVVAALVSIPLARISGWPGVWIPVGLSAVFGLLGVVVMLSREQALGQLLPELKRAAPVAAVQKNGQVLLDTSAIIDGRIADVSQTGFITGTLVIPRFVLDELRHVADSTDSLRRSRGRRGLEVLTRLRKEAIVPIQVLDVDGMDGTEVDGNLVKLAKRLGAPIVTTDFNLNRVAGIQGIAVLNVNDLANALKPVVLPGEELEVRVIQEGKEVGQGVGFLDDGTMVVVEGGRRYLNVLLEVMVTRVLQTAAGRLIFAQPKER